MAEATVRTSDAEYPRVVRISFEEEDPIVASVKSFLDVATETRQKVDSVELGLFHNLFDFDV